jgi:hypothetical protein
MDQSPKDQITAWPLVDGEQVRIAGHDLIIERSAHGQSLQTSVDEISAVNRGGREMVITRRESDPIVVQLRTLNDARELEQALTSRLAIHSHRARHWDPENPSQAL